MPTNVPSSHPERENPIGKNPSTARRKLWLFRLGAVAFGLGLLLVFEGLCWCFDWGRASLADDPFVGFRNIHPLFAADESGENYVIPKSRLKFFAPESFPTKKGEKTFRIFCLGGSTVQGRPWSKETSFTTFLELALQQADPRFDWEIINCGGVSYASYRLIPILSECLGYQPDLIILCTGHNEFLEDRTYGDIKHAPAALAISQRLFGRLRTFTLMRSAVESLSGQSAETAPENRPQLTEDTEPILDYKDSLRAYHRDDEWRTGVIAHYESNLSRMLAMCRQAGVQTIVVLPPSNLADCPPFKSAHRTGFSLTDLQQFEKNFQNARELYDKDVSAAIGKLKSALRLDDQYAAAWYELGQCYRTQGLATQAREALLRARDEDVCPLRMISPLEQALKRIVTETETPWLDAHALLEADCRQKILGDKWLIDHVHPTIAGYQNIADALVEKLAEQGIAQPADNWQTAAQELYAKHVEQLGTHYHLKGERTLEALRVWTQGQADGPPAKDRFPNRIPAGKTP